MRMIYLIAALAISCDGDPEATELTKKEGIPPVEEKPAAADCNMSECWEAETPVAKTVSVSAVPSEEEPEAPAAVAFKLTAANCVDPDLSQVMEGVTLMLCDGTMAAGTYVPPTVPAQPDLTNLVAGNIKNGVTINGVTGSYTGATIPADCSTNGQVNCVTTFTYKAADLTNLTAANVRKGATVAGVAGDYPSSSNPLNGANNVADLDFATFAAKIKSDADFEWFDAYGNRHQASGSSQIAAQNIKSGVSFFNVTGTLAEPTVNAWDLRKGVTVGGVAGKLDMECLADSKNCDGSNWAVLDNETTPCGSGFGINGCLMEDKATGKLFARASGLLTLSAANQYCQNLTVRGRTGWRLPTSGELVEAGKTKLVNIVPAEFFGSGSPQDYYWSDLEYVQNDGWYGKNVLLYLVGGSKTTVTTYNYSDTTTKFKTICVK